jgi:dsRNA-specific ribonuclease
MNQGEANARFSRAGSRKHRATVAETLGISRYIKCSPRQGYQQPSTTVLSLAVSAIVGASWLDSEKNIAIVSKVIERMGLVTAISCLKTTLTC